MQCYLYESVCFAFVCKECLQAELKNDFQQTCVTLKSKSTLHIDGIEANRGKFSINLKFITIHLPIECHCRMASVLLVFLVLFQPPSERDNARECVQQRLSERERA